MSRDPLTSDGTRRLRRRAQLTVCVTLLAVAVVTAGVTGNWIAFWSGTGAAGALTAGWSLGELTVRRIRRRG